MDTRRVTATEQGPDPVSIPDTFASPVSWLVLAITAFVTNLVWENAHGVLYDHAIPGWRYLQAAGGDVVLVGIGVGAAATLRRCSVRTQVCAAVVVLVGLAVGVEVHALTNGRWDYTAAMPTIWGIGISPLLQLPLTGLASLAMARWLRRRRAAWSATQPQRPVE